MSNSAKSRAELQFTASKKKRDAFQDERDQERQVKAEHTARLREMRLAKEASEREAARQIAAEKAAGAAPKRNRVPRVHRPQF